MIDGVKHSTGSNWLHFLPTQIESILEGELSTEPISNGYQRAFRFSLNGASLSRIVWRKAKNSYGAACK